MPASRSSTRTHRPGPLKELPLDLFLPPNPNLPQRPNKRVHSPGGPSLLSPTKRRILAEEGIISPGSLKSPIRVRALPVTRDGSPVKKLDLGLPKNSPASPRAAPSAPTSASESHPTRLTRQSASRRASDAFTSSTPASPLHRDDVQEMIDYFSPRPETITARLAPSAVSQIPREIPPLVDPQSIHYPGFHVFQDAYIITGPAMDLDVDLLLSPQKDAQKENLPPRRKARKSATAPASSDLKLRLTSPDARLAKANSTPCTPGRSLARERSNSATPTPRRPAVVLTRDTRLTPKLQDTERREMRRRLEEEVDEIPSDDEDDALL
ncbi:hypothetical protein DFH07DRAFT_824809 [Mycena maculata]|uniref:Uncharacterized protein n=1 Tax=Mycena maculata TaxID=230809 RepID=A0AAD7NAM5_9AGAR|nr:hypothetical protein DFH07DRAFT_824809 [Mycena maculata]